MSATSTTRAERETQRESAPDDLARHVLALARRHLGMDVAWVGEFAGDEYVYRHFDGDAASFDIEVDARVPAEETYCRRVVEGTLEPIIPDTHEEHIVRDMPVTDDADIRSYIGVPVRFADGQLFGVLCCASHEPDPALREQDLQFLQTLADVLARSLDKNLQRLDVRRSTRSRIRSVLDNGGPDVFFQPVVDLRQGQIIAVEALSRFNGFDIPCELWFADAAKVGLDIDLERRAIQNAVSAASGLPEGVALNVNVSPRCVLSGALDDVVRTINPTSLVIEITEHAGVQDYDELNDGLYVLRDKGLQLAIDDAGAGYASFRHVLELRPDVIKLDKSLTRRVGHDPLRDALTSALTSFAAKAGASVTAEGIESADCLRALRVLGVQHGQGFLFAPPGPLPVPSVELPT